MKRKLFVPITITLASLLLIGLLIYSIQRHIAGRNFESVNDALSSIIEIQAYAFYNGCLSNNQTYNLVIQGEFAEANALVQKATDSFSLIDLAEIVEGKPPSDSFDIIMDGELLRIECPIRNDDETAIVQNMIGVAIIQAQRLLNTVSAKDFRIDLAHGRKTTYGIPISANFTGNRLWDSIIIALLTGFVAIFIFQHFYRNANTFLDTRGLESIIYLFEQTERISASHSRNVAMLALFVGKNLGFRGKRLKDLYIAALLHDIGKIGIPNNILTKNGKLDPCEFVQMRQHPAISARILRSFKEFERLSPIVLYHHEREDGSGYPEGLTGRDIPFESKIIAVVDVFEALIGDRPYRDPICPLSAFQKMRSMPLDQKIVSLLMDHYGELDGFRPPRWALSYSPWMLTS